MTLSDLEYKSASVGYCQLSWVLVDFHVKYVEKSTMHDSHMEVG